MRVKTLITGGGTGGHVYPALSIIRHLTTTPSPSAFVRSRADVSAPSAHRATPEDEVVYIGNVRGLEPKLVPRPGIRCYFFAMAPPSSPRGLLLLAIATVRSAAVIARTRPQVAFATGGYVSFPVALASWLLRVPLVLFLPDVVPGRAVTWLTPLARRIAVAADSALPHLPRRKTVVTGYPVRDEFRTAERGAARARFGLPADVPVLCVFGGSQGSRSINTAVVKALPRILARWHVVHITGEARWPEVEAATTGLAPDLRARYHAFPYLHEGDMAAALAAADLVLCRSGASVLGELPATGKPAILVPLPETRVHQRENAQYLAGHGAAIILDDQRLTIDLVPALNDLLDRPERLEAMAAAARALDRPEAAERIAALIREAA